MSILIKPYEISVWEDVLEDGILVEKRLGIIGSDKMFTQSRALEPTLLRNVNGVKKLSFQMYKRYVDNVTGEQVVNPFSDWLINERKVKLKYEDKWYDFIVKNISETSTNYLYQYQLEDALVQELSKNGFGITLDAELMNNVGNAKDLAEYTLAETDWEVESETFIQTVEEALVYITIPAGTTAVHIKDQEQDSEGLMSGVDCSETITFSSDVNVLAFYSSCKNKPHRFQFIYSQNGYGKNSNGAYKINRKDDRTISEANCQYYIDFSSPETTYFEPNVENNSEALGLYLPGGFGLGLPGAMDGNPSDQDSHLSSWYRGKKYGFAQQSVYVPQLESYCKKYTTDGSIDLVLDDNLQTYLGSEGGFELTEFSKDERGRIGFIGHKASAATGVKFNLDYQPVHTYVLEYELTVLEGELKSIGGKNDSFVSYMEIYHGDNIYKTTNKNYSFEYPVQPEGKIVVKAKYNKLSNETDTLPYITIQPNYNTNDTIKFQIESLSISLQEDYLGYTKTKFVSPSVIQNVITNYNFESTSGWTATAQSQQSSLEKAEVENIYGRFYQEDEQSPAKFISIIDDFLDSTYDEDNEYTKYMKMSFYNNNQFILNSGVRDNRTMIGEMPLNEEWVLDYRIVDSAGITNNEAFEFCLGEYNYSTISNGYTQKNDKITFTVEDGVSPTIGVKRKIFKVASYDFTEESFKKDSKIYLKVKPVAVTTTTATVDGKEKKIPQTWFIEKIALYKKSIGADGGIIVPDYDEIESAAAQEYVDNSVLERKYHYFSSWYVDPNNPNSVVSKDNLPTLVSDVQNYITYKPVYNENAEKIRAVTTKESNYFNILQSIAETFEAWLELEITRDSMGAITRKVARFKNYAGEENYASFRYGVNLKDTQRTSVSTNIVTKLIVKQNANENGENGFCTIQRAGANPTGENYIYDFQYYQNKGIMNTEDYLNTVYYLNKDGDNKALAIGKDAELWESEAQVRFAESDEEEFSLHGYYPRIKKINEKLLDINDTLSGLREDLVQKRAELEVVENMLSAANSSLEQTREDFLALTGVYPEDAQDNEIDEITEVQIMPKEDWWYCPSDKPANAQWPSDWTEETGVQIEGKDVRIFALAQESEAQVDIKVEPYSALEVLGSTKDSWKFKKNSGYYGLFITGDWEEDRRYVLQYTIMATDGVLRRIGGHMKCFPDTIDGFEIVVKNIHGETIATTIEKNDENYYCTRQDGEPFENNVKYFVTVRCTRRDPNTGTDKNMWIQPNRAINDEVTCKVSDVKVFIVQEDDELAKNYDRTMHFTLTAKVMVGETEIERVQECSCTLPAGQIFVINSQTISAVDMSRTDVQKYIKEYTTYFQKIDESTERKPGLSASVTNKENAVKEKEQEWKNLLTYKQKLNNLFFKKYSRFILEGTWINEEYYEDDKYYADAQSVLYNSCYPQVAYQINVLSLSGLPGYELFKFELGDKTNVIDEEFFGEDKQEEIVITETSEFLDDPSKNVIKVQNFKDQFQGLFQKITATVQQTQYNAGSYERGAALFNANAEQQNEFITNAINSASTFLSPSKKHDVVWDDTGITITDRATPTNQVKIVGGAILFSLEDPRTKEQAWRTGITNQGISADLITAGRLDAGVVQIMSGDEPVFRWDAFGISAYDALWTRGEGFSTISGVNTRKFVRFDKNGIYGINDYPGVDGASWHPDNIEQIDNAATFALTWEGLKVTGEDGVVARLGKLDDYILKIGRDTEEPLMSFDNEGTLRVGAWSVDQNGFYGQSASTYLLRGRSVKQVVENPPDIFLSPVPRYLELPLEGTDLKDDIIFKAGDNFYVSENGTLYAGSARIRGNINAESGSMAGWEISQYRLEKYGSGVQKEAYVQYSNSFCIGTNTQNALIIGEVRDYGSGKNWDHANFRVTREGTLYAKGLVIDNTNFSVSSDGTISARSGYFGPWLLNADGLSHQENSEIVKF